MNSKIASRGATDTLFDLGAAPDDAHGQGATTELKERGMSGAFAVTMKVIKYAGLKRFTYWHIDSNCACGFNYEAGCIGSPLAFLEVARLLQCTHFRAFFIDNRQEATEELKERINGNTRCEVLCMNNRDALPLIAKQIRQTERNPQFAMGTVLCDPNGYFYGDAVPIDQLVDFCREFPRIDVILNLNARWRRMVCGHIRKGTWKKQCYSLYELPGLLNRKHWLIRNIISKGGDQFVLLVGRNFRVEDHKALGFYHWESPEGQLILRKVEGDRILQPEQRICNENPLPLWTSSP
jgi:hypothetical protein